MIYGLTGKKQSGKTTASTYLASKIPNPIRINFKDALLDEVEQKFPALIQAMIDVMDRTEYNGWGWSTKRLFQEKPPLMRALLQNYGTEVRREDNQTYWIDKYKAKAESEERTIITDDVRFLNEAQTIKDLGGIIIRVIREDLPNDTSHTSETEMDLIQPDYTISVKTGEHDKLYSFLEYLISPKESTPHEYRNVLSHAK
jgi:hypothetical protein